MKKIILILFILIPGFLLAQNTFRVMGKVTDTKGDPLIGANVYIRVLNAGTSTDIEGNYSFELSKDYARNQQVDLLCSFVGYKRSEVKITLTGNSIEQNFRL